MDSLVDYYIHQEEEMAANTREISSDPCTLAVPTCSEDMASVVFLPAYFAP